MNIEVDEGNRNFADYDGGDRTIKIDSKLRRLIPDFDIIPFDKIGRVGK